MIHIFKQSKKCSYKHKIMGEQALVGEAYALGCPMAGQLLLQHAAWSRGKLSWIGGVLTSLIASIDGVHAHNSRGCKWSRPWLPGCGCATFDVVWPGCLLGPEERKKERKKNRARFSQCSHDLNPQKL